MCLINEKSKNGPVNSSDYFLMYQTIILFPSSDLSQFCNKAAVESLETSISLESKVFLYGIFFSAKTEMINILQNVHHTLSLCTCIYIYTSVNAMFMFWLK